jgi:Skp family chaperone for outer membrane proteins
MMKAAAGILMFLAATATAGPPRVALVRVSDVHKQLYETVKANEDYKTKLAEIDRDPRWESFLALNADLTARRKVLETSSTTLDAATRERLQREFLIKSQEAKSLRDDFESFRAERRRELTAEMVAGIKHRLGIIRAEAEKLARQDGYDLVLDSSGNSNTGMPLLLYAKNPADITERLMDSLAGESSPAEDAAPAAEGGR